MAEIVWLFDRHGSPVDTVISLPETGDLQISLERDGWRVDHIDFDGDHAGNVTSGLPSRLEALRSAFSYALGAVYYEIQRRRPDGVA